MVQMKFVLALHFSVLLLSIPSTVDGNPMKEGKLKASFHNFCPSHDHRSPTLIEKSQERLWLVQLYLMLTPKPISVAENWGDLMVNLASESTPVMMMGYHLWQLFYHHQDRSQSSVIYNVHTSHPTFLFIAVYLSQLLRI